MRSNRSGKPTSPSKRAVVEVGQDVYQVELSVSAVGLNFVSVELRCAHVGARLADSEKLATPLAVIITFNTYST